MPFHLCRVEGRRRCSPSLRAVERAVERAEARSTVLKDGYISQDPSIHNEPIWPSGKFGGRQVTATYSARINGGWEALERQFEPPPYHPIFSLIFPMPHLYFPSLSYMPSLYFLHSCAILYQYSLFLSHLVAFNWLQDVRRS